MKNKSLENICKAIASAVGSVTLTTSGSISALASYIGFTRMEHTYLNSLIASGCAIVTPLFFISGAFFGAYSINKLNDLTNGVNNSSYKRTLEDYMGINKDIQLN